MAMTVAGGTAALDAKPPRHLTASSAMAAGAGTLLITLAFLLALATLAPLPAGARTVCIDLAAVLAILGAVAALLFGRAFLATLRRDMAAAAAFDMLPIPVAVTDAVNGFAFGNRAWTELSPTAAAPVALLRGGLDSNESVETLDRLAADTVSGRAARAMLDARLPGYAAQKIDVSTTPLADGAGAALWRIEVITGRDLPVAARHPTQARLQQIFDEMPVGLFSVDQTGRFLAINRTLGDWLETLPEALLRNGARIQEFLPPGASGSYDPVVPADAAEILLQGRRGNMLKGLVTQTIRRDGAGIETRSIVRDLAAKPLLETREPVRQRFQRSFEISPVGIALADASGRLTETNRALELLLADGDATLAGHLVAEFVDDALKPELRKRIDLAAGGGPAGAPLDLRLKGRREKNAALFISRFDAEDGGAAGLILHFIDLTEQKSLELQFAQSQKMQAVGQLAGGVAHDFNNLLTAMIGFCDLLLLRFKPGDQSFADIMQIKQNANRAANLVRQLLAFSRQQTLQPRVLAIGDVLAEVSHLLNRLIGDNIELRVIHGRELGPVKVDQGQLEQVIINLAVNARDAMPDGGTLTLKTVAVHSSEPIRRDIDTVPPGDWVLIQVTDDGLGIPPEIMDRIFEPFFSTKEMGSGTGLGLSTVYGIVKQTGGYVSVESTVGVGTTFSIYLPQYVPEAGESPEISPAPEAIEAAAPVRDLTGAGTILLVEDEDPVRLFSARALRNKGYNVLEARSGEAAVKLVQETTEQIDVIVTDVVMPRMDGPTMIKHVRELLPDVKVIFISGYAEDTFRKRLDDDSGMHFLPKPFSLKQLAEKVKDTINTADA